jgi:hypothetical protein
MVEIPAEFHELFEKPTFAHAMTMTPDGKPRATPVRTDYDPEDERLPGTTRARASARSGTSPRTRRSP